MEVLYRLATVESVKYRPTTAIYMSRPRVVNILQVKDEQFKYPPEMKYFKKPKATAYPLNLNKARALHVFRTRNFYDLEFIEEHIMKRKILFDDSGSVDKVKICTSRSLLNDLMKAPASSLMIPLSFCATRLNGITYLSKIYESNGGFDDVDTHHYKLQQFCLADKPTAEPNTDIGWDENEDLMAIHRSQLGKFDILYSSRICGVDTDDPIDDMSDFDDINKRKFIITKLLRENCNWKTNFRLLNWWVQAYLANVTEIHFGFKDEAALIRAPMISVSVKDLPKIKNFQPHVCIQFTNKILTLVEQKMSAIDCPYTVCQFHYDPDKRCFFYKMHHGKNEFSFLTENFVKHLQQGV